MAKVDVIKTSFAGGQFGASLLGRTDVAQYDTACDVVQNMLVRPFGSVISTPGTWLIEECKMSGLGTDSTVRLIPFIFNQTDAYVIEMGDKYFRFFTDRGGVVGTGSTLYEISHVFDEDELFDVQHTQLNDLVWMTHKNHRPQLLTRSAAASWSIADFAFLGGPFLDDNLTDITITPSDTAGTITLTLSATTSTIQFIPSSSSTNLGHIGSQWKVGTLSTIGVQGYVEITTCSSSTVATGIVKQPLSAGATKVWAEGAWSDYRGWPARVIFHDGRLWFARTDHEPQGVWGSHIYTYDDFSLNEQDDDEGINIKLFSNESNEIQWLASGRSLIAGTYGGAFIIKGASEDVITPTTVTATQEISWGTENILPKRIGNFFYYIQRFKKKIRELFYFWDNDSYKAMDKTIYCPEITQDGVVDMAYQEIPDTILYCVTTNGTIATLTREVDHEVQGWSEQTTDGYYESVCVIPSQSFKHDEVYVVVRREIDGVTKRYIELFENIEVPDRQDKCLYLHSALEYDAYEDTSSSTVNLSLSATSGTLATITCSTAYFSADDEGNRIRAIDSDGATVGEAVVVSYASTTVVTAKIVYDFDSLTYSGGEWGVSVEALSGLDHLEGETVKVLADGGTDKPDKVVSSGTIDLEYNYFVIMTGLPYTQKLSTLPFEAGSSRGTAQGKIQRINQVMLKVNRSYKGFSLGGTEDLAERISWREPTTLLGTPEQLYTGILSNINFRDDYRYGAQIVIVNDEPLPIELLSIMCMLDTQDKG
jgi:hypothetical protein